MNTKLATMEAQYFPQYASAKKAPMNKVMSPIPFSYLHLLQLSHFPYALQMSSNSLNLFTSIEC